MTPRQVALRLVLTVLLLALALVIVGLVDMLLLAAFSSRPVPPTAFLSHLGSTLLPGVFYVLSAAPFIGDLISMAI